MNEFPSFDDHELPIELVRYMYKFYQQRYSHLGYVPLSDPDKPDGPRFTKNPYQLLSEDLLLLIQHFWGLLCNEPPIPTNPYNK